jgi:hypothetical protein
MLQNKIKNLILIPKAGNEQGEGISNQKASNKRQQQQEWWR